MWYLCKPNAQAAQIGGREKRAVGSFYFQLKHARCLKIKRRCTYRQKIGTGPGEQSGVAHEKERHRLGLGIGALIFRADFHSLRKVVLQSLIPAVHTYTNETHHVDPRFEPAQCLQLPCLGRDHFSLAQAH